MNKISIICSNYNSDRWINEYLNYVNSQKGDGFDIIFIDANSKDNSLQTIKAYNFDKKIKVKIIELKERIGIYAAWNIGIKEADTEYIMNYNTDDMVFDYMIDVYHRSIIKFPEADIIYGPCGLVSTRNIQEYVGFGNWPEYSHQILTQFCICGPFPLVRKKAIEEVGYFDESFISSGDYEMWLRMSKKGYKFQRIPELIGSFYFRPDSIHSSNEEKARQEDFLIQNKYK